jgi:hypothetical protein
MKKVVERERNKNYYRVLHVPIWIWVFWILPGNLTGDLYARGPDWRHWAWLALVFVFCAWRGYLGRLPGCEPRPYITHWGVHQPNLPYRLVCYTAAWIALLVPYTLNLLGLVIANLTGEWKLKPMYNWLYYVLALAVVLATALGYTPRARRSTRAEGSERAWFYVAIWTVVPTQVIAWAMWRLGSRLDMAGPPLDRLRLATFLFATGVFLTLGWLAKLPRTDRYYVVGAEAKGGF